MPDLSQLIGSDLTVSANEDLLTVDSVALSQQAVLRRLMTNRTTYDNAGNVLIPGDYIFHPDYGAGLPRLVGKPINVASVTALITAQMFLEASVVRDPPPTVTVSSFPNGMFVDIQYVEADSNQPAALSFSVT